MSSLRALVTGSTRGIGHAVARAILAEGGRVAITARSAAGVEAAVRQLDGEFPGGVAGIVMDVRETAAVKAALDDAAARFGGLDVVVNNAGIGVYGNLDSVSDADWDAVIETNLSGPFRVMRAAIPHLRQAGGGWIVNVASLAGAHPFAGGGAYCASKAGLIALTESVMQEVRGDNIRVSLVLPGSVATEFSPNRSGDDSWKLAPGDVAAVVVDLLRHPARSLPSRVEIRPSRPKKG
jgi:NAD(P)-dependent dehydrogenase (short-subunit alcohol dehydrogenase family)